MIKVLMWASALAVWGAGAEAQSINFGDDTSEWANDGECDDRRFRGPGMSTGLDRDDIEHDATDCRKQFNAGRLTVWDFATGLAATNCAAIDFGDNQSQWPNDGKCDDPRFDGPGADHVLLPAQFMHDANDCKRLCELKQIAIRDY